ncbi:unnamed protein product [Fusarium graminearum]|nr:unnamed protein product [Fusarium graminearum]
MPINLDIIRSLIPKNLSRRQENNEPTLWEWILKAPHKYIGNRHHDICAILMHHGIMKAHEKQVKRSGLLSLGLALDRPGFLRTVRKVIEHTEYWNEVKNSKQVSSLSHLLIDGVLSFEAIRSAIEVDNVAFLELIVAHTGKLSAEVSWTDLEPFYAVKENAARDLLVDPANALRVASTSKSFACLKYLLEEGLAKEALVQHQDSTPLHVAAFMGSVEAVELLLGHGLDVAARNSLYQTPLHLAAQVGSLAVVKCLLRHGASDCFDAFVKTAETVALELGFVGIVYTLQEAKNEEARREHGKRRGPEKTRDHLATEFERAVRAYNYTGITNLMDSGCSIDVHMPKRQGGSALILALELESPAMVKWLFEHGASVPSAKYTNGVEDSVIEIASARAIFSNQLTDIVRRYWLQGGNLVTDKDFTFHDAVWNSNTLGLAALINECKTHIDTKGGKDLSAILNRQSLSVFYGTNNWRSGTHHAFTTPLQIASWLGNKPGVSLMVNHGALVDASDGNGWTPLMYARSVDMACHLIRLGTSTSAFCRFGSLTSMTRWFGPELFQELYELLPSGFPEELLDQRSPQQFPTACDDIPITGATLGKMSAFQQDLLAEDHAGRSLMHCIVCEDDLFYFALNNYPDLKDIGPFPWHLEWRSFSSLAFLTSSFRKYRRYVPFESFKTFLNLEPSRGWSPLCRAAVSKIVTIVENCLDMGADIDFEGCDDPD